MDDPEVTAAIASGDPAGIAAAYDLYAADLYGYCHWMLQQPADAADALRDAFVVAAAKLGELPEAPKLRPWLYALARQQCQHRLRTTLPVGGSPADADPDVSGAPRQDDLPELVRSILAELKPREREVIELTLQHDLNDADLATVLGVSWSRAHARAERARGRLEKALGVLLLARSGGQACPELEELLGGGNGQLTERGRDLVGRHIEQCRTCTDHKLGALRPAALFGLLPMAQLPPELREQVLRLGSAPTDEAVAYRRRVTRRRFTIMAPVVWVGLVWAAGLLLFIFTGSHPSRALAAAGPSVSNAASSQAAAATASTPATAPTHASAKRSAAASLSPAHVPPPVTPSASPTARTVPSPRPSHSPTPKHSPTPSHLATPSNSPSPSRSPSHSPSPSPSHSPSPSPSHSPSPSPSSSPTPKPT